MSGEVVEQDAGAAAGAEDAPPRKRLGLLIGLILGAAAGGGSFFAVSAGYAPPPVATVTEMIQGPPAPDWAKWEAPAFVSLPPLTVTLGSTAEARFLRINLVLEVDPGAAELVTAAEPRVIAGLVRFLRAVDERDFDVPALMLRLQAQMLRRVELAVPPGTVRAVLIQELLLN
ncbi:MAG: flagellar basal body-associated FliL family protein [Pseudomonadota bacterium]